MQNKLTFKHKPNGALIKVDPWDATDLRKSEDWEELEEPTIPVVITKPIKKDKKKK